MISLPAAQLFATLLAIQALPITDRGPNVTGDLRRMQGEWVVDHAENPTGEILPAYRGQLRHAVRGSVITYLANGQEFEQTVRLDETKTPKRMTVTDSKGPPGRSVYRLEGDRLTVIVLGSDQGWPTEFKPGPLDLVLIYRRESR
jgi:uncharacterized protein (TIGR03067 family)